MSNIRLRPLQGEDLRGGRLIMVARQRNRRIPQGGFTLIEVLIAMCVLALSSLALFSTLGFSKQLQTQAVDTNEAGEAANTIVESFRRVPYIVLEDAIPAGTYKIEDIATVYTTKDKYSVYNLMESGMASYLRSKLLQRHMQEKIVVEQAVDAVQVTVSVFHNDDLEKPVARMVTFITKNGINFR